jgi:hypothetical protein
MKFGVNIILIGSCILAFRCVVRDLKITYTIITVSDQVKKDEMGGACSTMGHEKRIQDVGWKTLMDES